MILLSIPNIYSSAVEYHRLLIPFRKIKEKIIHTDIESVGENYIKQHGITQVWFNRNIAPTSLDADRMFRMFRKLGVKIVCDVDDYWNLPVGHIFRNTMQNMRLKQSYVSQMKAADAVVVTHNYLADLSTSELGISKKRIFVAPNAIDPEEKQYNQDFGYNHQNLFWQGSVTHHYDLKTISKAVNDLGIKLYIGGYNPESHDDKTDYSKVNLEPSGHVFDDKPEVYKLPLNQRYGYYPEHLKAKYYHWQETGKMFDRKQFIHHLPVDQYMNTYQNKGICLIPLERSKFTACKSPLKMLEAGWAKKPVIVSGVHPYTLIAQDGKNCLTAYTTKSWKRAISILINNPEYADELRHNLHEDIRQNYLIDKVNTVRTELIEYLS